MLKKGFAAIVCLVVLCAGWAWAATNVWQLQTKVATAGGKLNVRGGADQTTVGQLVYNNYTTSKQVAVAVTANGGYKISSLKVNGAEQYVSGPSAVGATTTVNVAKGTYAQSVIAAFTPVSFAVNGVVAGATTAGTISSASTTYGKSVVLNAAPTTGASILTGVTGATSVADATTGAAVTFPYAKPVKITVANVTADTTVTATFATVSVSAGSNKVAQLGTDFTLRGSISGGGTAAWTVVSTPAGATATVASPASATTSVHVDALGVYEFKVTESKRNSFATVQVTVVASVKDYMNSSCNGCHNPSGALPSNTYANWSSSVHKPNLISCVSCHTDGAMPTPVNSVTVDPKTLINQNASAGTVGNIFCSRCHSAQNTGMMASRHMTSATGSAVPDIINHGTNCTQTCHFKSNNAYGCKACHSGQLQEGGTFGVADNHKIVKAEAAETCMVCHVEGRHGVPTTNWTKSSHNIANNGFENISCTECHNPHTTVATAIDGKADSCAGCHKYYPAGAQYPGSPVSNYGLYSSNGQGRAPHYGGKMTVNGATVAGQNQTQFMTQGAMCIDCHGHDNTINAGYAEGGHGKVSDDPMNAFNHYDWSARTNDGTRTASNCDRCHTTYGFLKFTNQTTGLTRLQLKAGQPSAVLLCITCHSAPTYDATQPGVLGMGGTGGARLPEGTLSLNVVPKGSAAGALKNGYFALFSSSVATLGAGNTKTQIQFPGYKNSSVCVPCHSGRTTDAYVRANIATIANYSTLQLSNYQHAANMGQTFIGKGAWEFTAGKYNVFAQNPSSHSAIKMAAGDFQGPCVGCHYSAEGKTHSLEVDTASATCAGCHGANAATMKQARFAEFSSARLALDLLIRSKFAPLYSGRGASDLNVERDGYFRYGRFGKAAGEPADVATAQNAYGAVYNWQLVKTWDRAAYAHNPAYARQILFDTLAYVQSNGADLTGSAANVAAAITAANALNSAVDTAKANSYVAPQASNALCIGCHATAVNAGAGFVQDNNGVRGITAEFEKWSHHVTGTTLQDAHCAACHLEGKVVGGKVVVDSSKHMADANIHLRNVDNDTDMVWNPEAPSFSTMDNFCLSCHDADGAKSAQSVAIQGIIVPAEGKTASALNPFGDTISNQYDKLERPAVVDAAGQFATSNPSHHAVSGKRYNGRTRVGTDRAVDAAFASNSSAALPGVRSTIYDAGKFEAAYVTLADAAGESNGRNGGTTLGDDSTLHCADCHTVGQFAARGTQAFKNLSTAYGAGITRYNKGAIGAHGSANEYMLRNNVGTDERHQGVETGTNSSGVPSLGYGTKPYLVCFNCHAFQTYGSVGSATAMAGLNHAGEYANSSRCNGPYNTVFGNMTGEGRLRSMVTQTLTSTGAANSAYGKPAGTTTTFGNVFGIQCNNCHNSGVSAGNIFGGIHGSKDATYTDGMGNTTKHYRFMPGLGNIMFVPGTKGGFTGGTLAAYNSYSGNRNGTGTGNTVGQTYSTLPYRTTVPGVAQPKTTTMLNGVTVPAYSVPYNTALPSVGIKTGSYQYTTGGVSNDLNWEQKSQQPVAGEYDFQAKSMGCYTIGPVGTVKVTGQNGDPNKLAAADSIEAGLNGPNGTKEVFDNWGGCDDHNGAQGAGTGIVRKVLRKVTY